MQFKMKALVAAVAVVAATGAHAAYTFNDATANNAELLFVLFAADGSQSSVFDLGVNPVDFNATSAAATANTKITWNFNANTAVQSVGTGFAQTSTDNAWNSAIASYSTLVGTRWMVVAGDRVGATITNQRYWSTSSSDDALVRSTTNVNVAGFNAVASSFQNAATIGTHTTNANGANVSASGLNSDIQTTFFNGSIDWKTAKFHAMADAGNAMNFYAINGNTAGASKVATFTEYAGTFQFNTDGTLAYTATAAVPEADSYAMLLAGLGVLGAIARRRRAI